MDMVYFWIAHYTSKQALGLNLSLQDVGGFLFLWELFTTYCSKVNFYVE